MSIEPLKKLFVTFGPKSVGNSRMANTIQKHYNENYIMSAYIVEHNDSIVPNMRNVSYYSKLVSEIQNRDNLLGSSFIATIILWMVNAVVWSPMWSSNIKIIAPLLLMLNVYNTLFYPSVVIMDGTQLNPRELISLYYAFVTKLGYSIQFVNELLPPSDIQHERNSAIRELMWSGNQKILLDAISKSQSKRLVVNVFNVPDFIMDAIPDETCSDNESNSSSSESNSSSSESSSSSSESSSVEESNSNNNVVLNRILTGAVFNPVIKPFLENAYAYIKDNNYEISPLIKQFVDNITESENIDNLVGYIETNTKSYYDEDIFFEQFEETNTHIKEAVISWFQNTTKYCAVGSFLESLHKYHTLGIYSSNEYINRIEDIINNNMTEADHLICKRWGVSIETSSEEDSSDDQTNSLDSEEVSENLEYDSDEESEQEQVNIDEVNEIINGVD